MSGALDYLFHTRESVGGGVEIGGHHLLPLLGTHLLVTLEAMVIAIALALPLAVWLGHIGRGQLVASTAANVGRAVPSFAVLVFFGAYLQFGLTNLVFGMVLLALPPIFTNAYVGVRQVDREVVDAARGMGLTERRLALRVELPLALPLIFGGIRTSVVNVLATATLGPYVGVKTLGIPIVNANVHGDDGRLGTAILIAVLAITAELLFAALQRGVTPRGLKLDVHPPRRRKHMRPRMTAALLALALSAGLVACGDDDDDAPAAAGATTTTAATTTPAGTTAEQPAGSPIQSNPDNASRPQITIGSKNFTENLILGEIYAQALKAAGYKVKTQLNLGSEQIALRAVKAGRVDAYPEYTGTIVTSFCKEKDADVPKDPDAVYDLAKSCIAEQGIDALPRAPFTNSNGFAVTQDKAEELGGITKLSDLAGKSEQLTISGPPECEQRTDCLLGLKQVYGLTFKRFLPIDIAKRHDVIESGQTDVGEVFTTDGQIQAEDEVLLEDDKQLFPPYNGTVLTKTGAADRFGPDFAATIAAVQRGLTTPVVQELNSRRDIDKESVADVASQYLTEAGYLPQ